MKQTSFVQAEFAAKKKVTRRERLLTEMAQVVPWLRLLDVLQPHLGITYLCSILGRRWGGNDGGINDRAFAHQHALLAQVTIDVLEDRLRQGPLFQQVPEFQQCGSVMKLLRTATPAIQV